MLSVPWSDWGGGLTSVKLPAFLVNIIDGEFVIEDDVRQPGSHGGEQTILIERKSITVGDTRVFKTGVGINRMLVYCRRDLSLL